jgi:hypothetical protein
MEYMQLQIILELQQIYSVVLVGIIQAEEEVLEVEEEVIVEQEEEVWQEVVLDIMEI